MNLTIPPSLRPYALALLVLVVVAAIALVIVVIVTGRDLSDPRVTQLLGYAVTIATILIAALGLSAQVQAVHNAVNGTVRDAIDVTATGAWQAGNSAPPGSPPPPAPSTLLPPAPPAK